METLFFVEFGGLSGFAADARGHVNLQLWPFYMQVFHLNHLHLIASFKIFLHTPDIHKILMLAIIVHL